MIYYFSLDLPSCYLYNSLNNFFYFNYLSNLLNLRNNLLDNNWYLNWSFYNSLHWHKFLNVFFDDLNFWNEMVYCFFSYDWHLNFNNFLDNFLNCLNFWHLYNNFLNDFNDSWYFNNNFLNNCSWDYFFNIIVYIFNNLNRNMYNSLYLLNFYFFYYFLHYSINSNNIRNFNNSFNYFLYNLINLNYFRNNSKDLQYIVDINNSHDLLIYHSNNTFVNI